MIPRRPSPFSPAPSRHGSAYILVLGASVLVMVIGLSASAIVRTQLRSATSAQDFNSAGSCAASGIDIANAFIASDAAWRTKLTATANTLPTIDLSPGRLRLVFLDRTDGLLAVGETDPVQVFAIAQRGTARRYYSATIATEGSKPMDVLNCAIHAGGAIIIAANANVTATGGPISSNASITVGSNAVVNGSLEAATISRQSGSSVTGTSTAGAPAKALPGTAAWDALVAGATTISFSSLTSGVLEKVVLTKTYNPYGTANSQGVYRISVPLGSSLVIRDCRIDATLLIEVAALGSVATTRNVLWDPQAGGIAMIVKAPALTSVTLANTTAAFTEDSLDVNLNPSVAPYLGASDNSKKSTYTPRINGIVHITGLTSATINSNLAINGCLIVEPGLFINGSTTAIRSAAIAAAPPAGYKGRPIFRPASGTFQWETQESFEDALDVVSNISGGDSLDDVLDDVVTGLNAGVSGLLNHSGNAASAAAGSPAK